MRLEHLLSGVSTKDDLLSIRKKKGMTARKTEFTVYQRPKLLVLATVYDINIRDL